MYIIYIAIWFFKKVKAVRERNVCTYVYVYIYI